MRIISHRGNLDGPNTTSENTKVRIDEAILLGLDVEIDARIVEGKIFLGHDGPAQEASWAWISERKERLWIHCKNAEAMDFFLGSGTNYFWHQNDEYTMTSKGYVWVYPGKKITKNSVAVLPELWAKENLDCFGVCSDYPTRFMRLQDLP